MERATTLRLAAALLTSLALAGAAHAEAYRLQLTGGWTPDLLDDPATLPSSAHFTRLFGATHTGEPLWAPGGLATPGIERVAETGNSGLLFPEVSARIDAGSAGQWLAGEGVGATGSMEFSFDADAAFPLVTLISMVAPTPDWFIGVSGISLVDGNGAWIDRLAFDLRPWDAGTEEGAGFSLSNPASSPHGPIHPLLDSPFLDRPVIARLTIERAAVPEPSTATLVGLGLLGLVSSRSRARRTGGCGLR